MNRLTTVLKRITLALVLLALLALLWDTKKKCEALHGPHSRYCVD